MRSRLLGLLLVAAAALIVTGVWLMWMPLGVIAAGLGLGFSAWLFLGEVG